MGGVVDDETDIASALQGGSRGSDVPGPEALGRLVPSEGLRERKKRLMRQLISDTATEMFVNRGFDEVRVAEIAAACGVSEKTVYNYFPTKESLLLDREESMAEGLRRALGPGAEPQSPIEAVLALIEAETRSMFAGFASDREMDLTMIRKFADLVESTPSLRAAQRDMVDRLVQVVAEAMAARAGVDPEDPEPQIAADAIMGLWRVQFRSMHRYADEWRTPAEVQRLVIADVRRAARLIDSGVWSFGMVVQGRSGQEQFKAAAAASNDARKQVVAALKQARDAWRQVMAEAQSHDHEGAKQVRDQIRAQRRAEVMRRHEQRDQRQIDRLRQQQARRPRP
jgi:AcrR family transcriptional regulator